MQLYLTVFNDEFGLSMPGSGNYQDEKKFVLLGTSNDFCHLVVVLRYRESSDKENKNYFCSKGS